MPRGCASSGCRRRSWRLRGERGARGARTASKSTASRRGHRRRPGHGLVDGPEARADLTTGDNDPLPSACSPRSSPRDLGRGRRPVRLPRRHWRYRARRDRRRHDPGGARGGDERRVRRPGRARAAPAFDEGGGVPQFGTGGSATSDPIASEHAGSRPDLAALGHDARRRVVGDPHRARRDRVVGGMRRALALALIALVALASALGSARGGEVVVLRVLSVPARTQSRRGSGARRHDQRRRRHRFRHRCHDRPHHRARARARRGRRHARRGRRALRDRLGSPG